MDYLSTNWMTKGLPKIKALDKSTTKWLVIFSIDTDPAISPSKKGRNMKDLIFKNPFQYRCGILDWFKFPLNCGLKSWSYRHVQENSEKLLAKFMLIKKLKKKSFYCVKCIHWSSFLNGGLYLRSLDLLFSSVSQSFEHCNSKGITHVLDFKHCCFNQWC